MRVFAWCLRIESLPREDLFYAAGFVMQGKWVLKRGGAGDMWMVFDACEDGQLISNENGEK